MDDAQSGQLRERILEGSGAVEIWETMKQYKISLEDPERGAYPVWIDVRYCQGGGWALFARNESGREQMLTNLESSPDKLCDFAHWEKLRAPWL
jgi:hypothetical protein